MYTTAEYKNFVLALNGAIALPVGQCLTRYGGIEKADTNQLVAGEMITILYRITGISDPDLPGCKGDGQDIITIRPWDDRNREYPPTRITLKQLYLWQN